MKRILMGMFFGLFFLASVSVAQSAFVPASILNVEPLTVVLPPGSMRDVGDSICTEGFSKMAVAECYLVPASMGDVIYELTEKLLRAGFGFLEERPSEPGSRIVSLHQMWSFPTGGDNVLLMYYHETIDGDTNVWMSVAVQ